MTNLPINASTAPASAPSQPGSNSDIAPQDGQGFGNVLARQVADSAAPSGKKADKDAKDAATSSSAASDKNANIAPDVSNILPADMLAALLAQQNQTAKAAAVLPDTTSARPADALVAMQAQHYPGSAAIPSQLVMNKLADSDTPENALAIAGKKGAANATLPQGVQPALDSPQPDASAAANSQQTFTEALKAMGKNDNSAAPSGEALRSIKELTARQPAVAAPTPTLTSSAPVLAAADLSSQLTISTPVSQAGWGNEFSQKITWLATQHDQSAELHLNPPDLGPMDVVLKVSGDQATALFTSPHAAVRDAIESALPKLREMLADNGIMLGNATVSDQSSRKTPDDFARGQQGSGNRSDPVAGVTAVGLQGGRVTSINRHNGLVDTFA